MPVELRDADPKIRADRDGGDVAHPQRPTPGPLANRNVCDVLHALEVPEPPDSVVAPGDLDRAGADVLIRAPDGRRHLLRGDAIGLEPHRVEQHLILLHEPADACDLGHTSDALERVTDLEVLDAAELGLGVAGALHRVLIHPADAGRVRSELRLRGPREPSLHSVQPLEDPGPRPVEIGPLLKDHVHERGAEHGLAAHRLDAGHAQHSRNEGIRHLVFDHLRRLARVVGIHDDLHVREVRDRVHRHRAGVERARDEERHRERRHQAGPPKGPGDELRNHGRSLPARAVSRA